MSLYDDKSFEEIQAIVQRFAQTHKERYGQELDPSLLKTKLLELIQEKKERHFRSVFESMSSNNVEMAVKVFENMTPRLQAGIVENWMEGLNDAEAVQDSGQMGNNINDNDSQLQVKGNKVKRKKAKPHEQAEKG